MNERTSDPLALELEEEDLSSAEPSTNQPSGSSDLLSSENLSSEERSTESSTEPEEEEDLSSESSTEFELDDETLDALITAYGDKLAEHPSLKSRLEEEIQRRQQELIEQSTLESRARQTREAVLVQGREAVAGLAKAVEEYRQALERLEEGDEIDLNKLPSIEDVQRHVATFGTAVYADVTAEYDQAFAQAVMDTAKEVTLTPQDAEEIAKIVATAQRMEGDERQADRAKSYLFGGVLKVLVNRAKDIAKEEARAELDKKRSAVEKIANSNALKVALAKQAGKKIPPATTGGSTSSAPESLSREDLLRAYEAARDRGDIAEADRLAFELSRRKFI